MQMKHPIEHPEQCLRLDIFLRGINPHFTRQVAREVISAGSVLVNGRTAKAGYQLSVGDVVEVLDLPNEVSARADLAEQMGAVISAEVSSSFQPPWIKILYEDEALVALYKPRGMHSIVLDSDDPLTVADSLALWRQEQLHVSRDLREAGLVQRLDRFTEGVILAAKSSDTWEALHHELVRGHAPKRYAAVVEGIFPGERKVVSGLIDSTAKRVSFPASEGEISESVVTVVARNKSRQISLVEVSLTHAVRHQVRAHLAGIGFPLVGDHNYGAKRTLHDMGFSDTEGFYLVAKAIQCRHPLREESFQLQCEAPWERAFRNLA